MAATPALERAQVFQTISTLSSYLVFWAGFFPSCGLPVWIIFAKPGSCVKDVLDSHVIEPSGGHRFTVARSSNPGEWESQLIYLVSSSN